jgi:hypothetical protein
MKDNLKNIREKIDKFGIVKLLIILIVAFAIFQAGIFVGYHKARFYSSIGSNYYRSSSEGRDRNGMMGKNMMQNFNLPGGNGAVGKIVSINLPTIVVASPDNIEKTINISDNTLIRQFRDTLNAKDLTVGEHVVVLGEISNPDNGVIDAKLIRLIPPPPSEIGPITNYTTSSTSTK